MDDDLKDADYHTKFEEPYWHQPDRPPFWDFNREFIEPGQEMEIDGETVVPFPDGAIQIRMDDDFWVAAALPLIDYQHKTIKEIVQELWPDIPIEECVFKPDSHDVEAWQAYFAERKKKK